MALIAILGLAALARPGSAQVLDTFDRPDAAALGNGWIEKNPGGFALVAGEARKQAAALGYRDNAVYRPAAEDLLDVEVSLEFRLLAASPGYPQIFTRLQSATAGVADRLDGYVLYVADNPGSAVLGRQVGSSFVTTLASITITPALNTTDRYRLRLRSTGTTAVAVAGYVERWTGSAWAISGQATFNDTAAARIATPGSVGFGGYVEASYAFDNFSRVNLGTNPTPLLSSISPSSATAGGSPFLLTAQGTGFAPDSVVRWNGSSRQTSFISATQLQASITADDIAAAGTASVTVFTPAPGGGTSTAVTFTINSPAPSNPVPVLQGIAPAAATAGGSDFLLTVQGSSFVPGSVVQWNGTNRTTAFISATQLTASITAADIAAAGTASVTVFSPTPGGGTSTAAVFAINAPNNPVPLLQSIAPTATTAGSAAFALTVQGSEFVPGSVVRWNGASRTTTFVSATQLQAAITAADVASAGTATVTVFSPAPGGGTSAGSTFTINQANNPVPVLQSLSPTTATAGSAGFQLTAFGSAFVPGSVVRWNGADRTTTFVSATELQAAIAAADIAGAGTASVAVFTPGPGGGTSGAQTFTIGNTWGGFTDTFDRADNAVLGNGWIEKSPAAFSIVGNEARKQAVGTGYLDNVVYRPSGEDLLDVEASVELRLTTPSPGYPMVLTRLQSATAGTPGSLDAYLLYVDDNPSLAVLGRQVGSSFVTTLATIAINPALNTTDRYRLRLRTTGTTAVALSAFVERWTGSAWVVIGQAAFNDTAAARIATPGSVGIGGYIEAAYAYDNFSRVNLGGGSPPPQLSSISPASATAGGSAFLLAVQGSNFVPESLVRWNGADRATSFVSATQLTASITAADIASAGAASVTVFTPAPGGGTSAPATFTVNAPAGSNPVPVLQSLSPSSTTAGGSAFLLTVQGSSFVPESVVRWNGSERTTSFVSATQLTASITAADVASAGTASVTVFTPAPGGGVSAAQAFTIGSNFGGFVDNFNRTDNAALGNGWIEKSAAAFALVSGEARKQAVGTGYLDNVAYRPASEDLLDVEASVEMRLLAPSPGYPQIFTRLQSATASAPGALTGYMLYIPDSTGSAILGRQTGSAFVTTLATFALSPALNTTDRYRLRLRSTGAQPVSLLAAVERWTGSAWQTIGQATFTDSAAEQITGPGSVGFGGYIENASYSYDNFSRTNLGTGNPPPQLSSISPSVATAGGSGFSLTAQGSGFEAGSVVQWNGVTRATTFISATQLQAAIPASDIAVSGSASVAVYTAGSGSSTPITFTINPEPGTNPVPLLQGLAPSSAQAGGAAFLLTAQGSNFVTDSVVRWNGAARSTTFVSPTQLQAAISAADIATAGTAAVTVFTPSPGGGTSAPVAFSIDQGGGGNPAPVLQGISPKYRAPGSGSFTLSVQGLNFVQGSVVRWNGANRTTFFVSPRRLQATITAADVATAGTASVTVFTPSPGGGTSAAVQFLIASGPNPNTPVLTDIFPSSAVIGTQSATLTVLGQNFTSSSVVRRDGAVLPTTFVSSTELRATLSAADLATESITAITVLTAGIGSSAPEPFFVRTAATTIFVDNFNSPDSPNLGNNWTEKLPSAFSLQNGEAVAFDTWPYVYRDTLVYRPPAEDRRDIQVSTEFVRRPGSGQREGYVQLHARVQRNTIAQPDTEEGYIVYIEDMGAPSGLAFSVQPAIPGMGECIFQLNWFDAPLLADERYRLTTSLIGGNPVQLTGSVEWFDGARWQPYASATVTHSNSTPYDPTLYCPTGYVPAPISNGGATGFAKWSSPTDRYDNFYWMTR